MEAGKDGESPLGEIRGGRTTGLLLCSRMDKCDRKLEGGSVWEKKGKKKVKEAGIGGTVLEPREKQGAALRGATELLSLAPCVYFLRNGGGFNQGWPG